jgi:hypothetical protein
MYGDFMQGSLDADDEFVFSDITFEVLESSGWYTVDYSFTDSIIWGKNAGCDFFDKKCDTNGVPLSTHFCATTGQTCTQNRNAKGGCNIATHSTSLPAEFQNFSDPYKGSLDNLIDDCPTVGSNYNGNCRGYGS